MGTIQERTRGRFWLWIVVAFILGAVVGVVALIALQIVLQAMISYAQ